MYEYSIGTSIWHFLSYFGFLLNNCAAKEFGDTKFIERGENVIVVIDGTNMNLLQIGFFLDLYG